MLFLSKNKTDIVDISHISKIDQKNMKRIFARVFSTDDGKKLLAYLQYITFHRSFGADVSDSQLRYMEGQRSLVSTILRFIDQGKNN